MDKRQESLQTIADTYFDVEMAIRSILQALLSISRRPRVPSSTQSRTKRRRIVSAIRRQRALPHPDPGFGALSDSELHKEGHWTKEHGLLVKGKPYFFSMGKTRYPLVGLSMVHYEYVAH